ncbi:MAG: trigger factor, partial [Alphaproteobacteria bacterium]|nr:trigger factor [Alphaproteobacteria bacterium]
MQVTELSADGLKRAYKITVESNEIDKKLDEKLTELAGRIRLPGFRPGKVPASHLKKLHGDALMGEVLEETVNTTSREVLDDQNVRPAVQPDVEIKKFEEGSDLEYEISLEIMPEIEVADLSKVKLERQVAPVEDSEIEEFMSRLADQQRRFEAVSSKDYKAKDGDAVLIDFVGKLDGEPFEGGAAENYQLVLGSGGFIPGFEEQLVGVSAGDEKEVAVTFPEDYGAEHLAGKEAVFDVTVHEVQEPKEVEINDEFATQLGLETLDELKDRIKEQIQQEHDQLSRMKLKRALLDALDELHEFPLPSGMVDMEFEHIWQDSGPGGEEDDAETRDEKALEEEKEEYRKMAERRVRLGLLLSEIGEKNDVSVAAEELNNAIMREAQRFPGQEQQVFGFYQKNPQAIQQLRAPLFEDKVIDFILELADVSEKKVDLDTLTAQPEDDEEAPAKKTAAKKTPAK